jgi:hypothetical protein
MKHPARLMLVILFLATGADAAVFKCRDAAGEVVYTQEPCAKAGTRQEKKFTRQDLKANEMRMRPRPASGGKPSFSQGSNYQGAAPDRKDGSAGR